MQRLKLARILIKFLGLLPLSHAVVAKVPLPKPFFILGSGRNGSSLLNLLLNQHPDLFLPTEQYFIGPSILKYQLYNHILWRDLVKIIVGEILPNSKSHTWQFDPTFTMHTLINCPREYQSLQYILHSIYHDYSEQMGKRARLWGDSTFMNTHYLSDIYRLYPDSKYIFLIRDGRDVAASFKAGGLEAFGNWAKPIHAAKHWNQSVVHLNWISKKTRNVLVIKYENLVNHPEVTLGIIFDYLNVAVHDCMNFYNRIPMNKFYAPKHHNKLKQPIDNQSIGQWKSRLNTMEINQIMPIISKNLSKFNYETNV